MTFFGPQDDDHNPALPDDTGDGLSGFSLEIPDDDEFDIEGFGAVAPPPVPVSMRPSTPEPLKDDGDGSRDGGKTDRGGARRERRRTGATFLGVYVTQASVYGTLLQETEEGYQVLRRFARQRNAQAGDVPDFAGITADTASEDAADVAIQFGDSNDFSGSDLFLGSEFGDLANLGELDDTLSGSKQQAAPVVFELKDLLDECATAGYDRPLTAFCIGQPAVDYVELLVPNEKRKEAKKEDRKQKIAAEDAASQPLRRERLLGRLAEEYTERFEKDRVAFVPMTPREGVRRALAAVPTVEESLAESLELLREQSGMRSVAFRAIDTEVNVLVGLARWAFPPAPDENTAIVRVGTENTLVILLQGNELHHQEHMLSVTTFDGPDTICSRVLLQQDVQGIGTVHQVVVLSEEREEELVRGFAAFYPDARVEALRRGLREHGIAPAPGDAALSARALPAVGVALRLALARQKETPFEDANLLPKRLRRVRPKLDVSVAWHTLVAGVLIFLAGLFFVSLYVAQQREIAAAEQRLAAYPQELQMSSRALQHQIDSLQTVHLRITQTLNTIDSLLVGSDRWSRSMARLARSTASTGGTWVQQWNPQAGSIQLAGFATGRDQVVQFAERMEGSIDELKFHAIRDYPVYSYVVTAPIPNELPEVARYLRDQVDVSLPPVEDPLGNALIGGPAGATPSAPAASR